MKTTVKNLVTGTFLILALILGYADVKGTEVENTIRETNENSIRLENWMIDETIWNANSFQFAEFVRETETELEVESWMISGDAWNFNTPLLLEAEMDLELESWMTCENMWEVQEIAVEEELIVESWMIDDEVWK